MKATLKAFLSTLALLASSTFSHAQIAPILASHEVEIFQIREPVNIISNNKVFPHARAKLIPTPSTITIGRSGGLVLLGHGNFRLSIVGPAQVRFLPDPSSEKQVYLTVDYGQISMKGSDWPDWITFIHAGGQNIDATTLSESLEFYLDVDAGGHLMRLRNLGTSMRVGRRLVHNGMTYAQSREDTTELMSNFPEEISWIQEIHQNNLGARTPEAEVESPIRRRIESGLEYTYPLPGQEPMVGFFFEYGTQFYLKLPKRPERQHFLYSPSLRVGLRTGMNLAPAAITSEDTPQTRLMRLGPTIGLGWLGMYFDALFAYELAVRPDLWKPRWNASITGFAGYRFDFSEFNKDEIGLRVGMGFGLLPIANNPSVNPVKATQNLRRLSFDAGLSVRF